MLQLSISLQAEKWVSCMEMHSHPAADTGAACPSCACSWGIYLPNNAVCTWWSLWIHLWAATDTPPGVCVCTGTQPQPLASGTLSYVGLYTLTQGWASAHLQHVFLISLTLNHQTSPFLSVYPLDKLHINRGLLREGWGKGRGREWRRDIRQQ